MIKATTRNQELREALTLRRREMHQDVRGRIRDGRADRPNEVGDNLEQSDADIQEELALALLEMRAATLTLIDEAVDRIDQGKYGSCSDCAGNIPAQRLRALPFTVRCRDCQEKHEREHGRSLQQADRRGAQSLFATPILYY